jgi:hypothetical protein
MQADHLVHFLAVGPGLCQLHQQALCGGKGAIEFQVARDYLVADHHLAQDAVRAT